MGLISDKIYYGYNDVTIVPSVISNIEHRSECNPFDENGMLPLFTAPMDTVVNEYNFNLFVQNKINAILPRTVSLTTRIRYSINGKWAAYSLNEFSDVFCLSSDKYDGHKIKALIDVANGHMAKIFNLVKAAKGIYGDNIEIMVGNIANPLTYKEYADIGVDYIRCSVGSGCGCLSTSNTGIHYPIASLINDIVQIRDEISSKYDKLPKIIADGGIRNYSDAIKALALGSDYVMIGSVFAKMLESAAPKSCNSDEWFALPIKTELKDLTDIHREENAWYGTFNDKRVFLGDITAKFYGMASRDGQIALNGKKTKTSEGLTKTLNVEYTMDGWVNNFTDYLCSAMSYTDSRELEIFKRNTKLIVNSQCEIKSVNK